MLITASLQSLKSFQKLSSQDLILQDLKIITYNGFNIGMTCCECDHQLTHNNDTTSLRLLSLAAGCWSQPTHHDLILIWSRAARTHPSDSTQTQTSLSTLWTQH